MITKGTLNQWYIYNGYIVGCIKGSTDGVREGDEVTIGPLILVDPPDQDGNFETGTVVQSTAGSWTLGVRRCH